MSGVGKQNRACWSGHTESNVLGMSVPDQVPNSTHLPLEQQVDESVCVCVCVCLHIMKSRPAGLFAVSSPEEVVQ